MSRAAVCTVFANNHLPRGRVLERSLRQIHPDIDLFMLVTDVPGARSSSKLVGTTIIGPTDVMPLEQVLMLSALYAPLEYCAAFKPFLLNYLLQLGYEKVVYLDSDVAVLGSLSEIFNELDEASVTLTPHLTAPIPFDGKAPTELHIRIAGSYNTGFVGVSTRNESRAFLAWWQSRVCTHGFADVGHGMSADQGWMDLVPGLFARVKILRHPGYNVAYWNLHSRELTQNDGRWLVNGEELAFFHFSGFDPGNPTVLSRHQNRIQLDDWPFLAKLVAEYHRALQAADHDEASRIPYGYGQFSNGVPFTPLCRLILRHSPHLFTQFPQPHDAAATPSYFHWLRESVTSAADGHEISRYAYNLHRSRADLQRDFPEPLGRDAESFRQWMQAAIGEVPDAFAGRVSA